MRGGTPVNLHFIAYLTAAIICDAFLREPDSSNISGFSLKSCTFHFIGNYKSVFEKFPVGG